MSLIRGSTLSVALFPDSVGIVLRQGRAQPRSECLETATVEGPTWRGAVKTLQAWLAGIRPGHGRMSLLLSSRFVRYALAPWPPSALNREETAVWARAHLEATYGDLTGWRVVCDAGGYGQAYVACAVPEDLVHALHDTVKSTKFSLGSITPAFVFGWNHWRSSLRSGQLFGVAESDRLVLGCWGPSGWESLRALSTNINTEDLKALVRREQTLLGKLNQPVTVLHAPGASQGLIDRTDSGEVHWLSLEGEEVPPALALARLAALG